MNIVKTIILLVLLTGYSASSQAVSVTPGDCFTSTNCWTNNNSGGNDEIVFGTQLAGLELLYKAEAFDVKDQPLQAQPASESGTLQDSYSTLFVFGTSDYTGATISYDGGDFVDCSASCYLAVKDGDVASPARWLFNLALNPFSWNGQDDLVLSGFWPGQGSISHVAIYGELSPIPLPASVWLFGSALIGFIGYSRRTRI